MGCTKPDVPIFAIYSAAFDCNSIAFRTCHIQGNLKEIR